MTLPSKEKPAAEEDVEGEEEEEEEEQEAAPSMQGSSPSSLGAGKPSLDLPEGLFEIFLVVFLEGTSGVGDGGGGGKGRL